MFCVVFLYIKSVTVVHCIRLLANGIRITSSGTLNSFISKKSKKKEIEAFFVLMKKFQLVTKEEKKTRQIFITNGCFLLFFGCLIFI